MRPALAALAVGLLAVPLTGSAPPFRFDKGIGLVVVERIGSPYLVIRDGDLAPGTVLAVVDLSRPLKVVKAVLSSPLPSPCAGAKNVTPSGTCYAVSVAKGTGLHWGPHIAVVAPPERFSVGPSGVRAELEPGGETFSFRVCTSGEGLHFTVWRGPPLSGRRVWYRYYDLGYDLELTCEPEDLHQ